MPDLFSYCNCVLCAEAISLQDIAAEYGTPCYVYSRAAIEQQWQAYDTAFNQQSHLIFPTNWGIVD